MKNTLILVLGLVLAVVLLAFMLCFTVRYDEVAVLTTFGAASEKSIRHSRAYPYLRLPPPIQSVHAFTTRVQLLEDQMEELQTAEGNSVIIRTTLAWRVENPLEFYKKLQNMDNATIQLRPLLRDVRNIIGRYRFDQMVNTDPGKIKLIDIEKEALDAMRKKLAEAGFGIHAEHVGIRRLLVPEQTTQTVFERMKQTRQTMAEQAKSEGNAAARAIREDADSTRRIILAFAENRATAIRAQGDMEAAEYYKAFATDPELAVFLRRMEMLRKVLPHNSTFVLDAQQLGVADMLKAGAAPDKP